MASSLVQIFAVLLTINSVLSLKCYTCDSSKGITCSYGLLSILYPSEECTVKSGSSFLDTIVSVVPFNCAKLVAKDKEGNSLTARGCVPSTGPLNSCNAIAKLLQFGEGIDNIDCFVCDHDNCNSASRIGGTMTFAGLLIACFLYIF